MARAATTSDVFNAVAEPKRREIIGFLGLGEAPVGTIVRRLRAAQPVVSKHLRVLKAVGLVKVRAEGRQRLYRLIPGGLKKVHDWAALYERLWSERFDRLDAYLTDAEKGHAR